MSQSQPSLPASLDEISASWIGAALTGWNPAAPAVSAMHVERVGHGFGLTGVIARVHLQYVETSPEMPTSLIVKLPVASRETASLHREQMDRNETKSNPYFRRCAREVRFYREIGSQSPVPAPRCYFAAADENAGAIALLLEDIREARQGDVLSGCSPAEARLVLDQLAPFHARWWSSSKQLKQVYSWLPGWAGDHHVRHERYRRQIDPFLERWATSLPVEILVLLEGMRARYGAILAALDNLPATIIHADLHLDNVLFKTVVDSPSAVILDWQSVCRGPAAIDLAQFICGSLTAEARRETERELLARYLAGLRSRGASGYAPAQLDHDIGLALLRLLGGTVGWLASADLDSLVGRERELVHAALGDGRLIAALLDHHATDILAEF